MSAKDKAPVGFVPHEALHAEREKRKAAEDEVIRLRAKYEPEEQA